MASAAITVTDQPATIESDSSEAVITLGYGKGGMLYNVGSTDVYAKVSRTSTEAATVVTSGAQAQYQVPIPAGGSLRVLPHYRSVAHKTISGSSTLAWQPGLDGMRGG